MTNFFDGSQKAKTTTRHKLVGQPKYPWKDVPIGKSFAVPRENIKFNVLRSLASKTGKDLGKRFVVVDHGEGSPYEVYCAGLREGVNMAEADKASGKPSLIEALNREKEKENGTGKEEPSSEKESE